MTLAAELAHQIGIDLFDVTASSTIVKYTPEQGVRLEYCGEHVVYMSDDREDNTTAVEIQTIESNGSTMLMTGLMANEAEPSHFEVWLPKTLTCDEPEVIDQSIVVLKNLKNQRGLYENGGHVELEYLIGHNDGKVTVDNQVNIFCDDGVNWKSELVLDETPKCDTPNDAAIKLAEWLEKAAKCLRSHNFNEINLEKL